MPPEHQSENGGQNHYQEVEEVQTSTQPQEIVPVYDHVNLNNIHEVNNISETIVADNKF